MEGHGTSTMAHNEEMQALHGLGGQQLPPHTPSCSAIDESSRNASWLAEEYLSQSNDNLLPLPKPVVAQYPCNTLDHTARQSSAFGPYDSSPLSSLAEMEMNVAVEKAPTSTIEPHTDYDSALATQEQLEDVVAVHPLPDLTGSAVLKRLHYDIFSTYRRLFTLVLLVNATLIIFNIAWSVRHPGWFRYKHASTATAANLFVATVMRHEHNINLLFRICTSPLMRHTPLIVRRYAAKIYCFGGVHSACGVSAAMWYIYFAVLLVHQYDAGTAAETDALLVTTGTMLLLFSCIIAMAHPSFRARWHNQWEWSHRYAGWTAVAIIWSQTFLTASAVSSEMDGTLSQVLVTTPAFWLLLSITCLFIYPWLLLRRRECVPERLSDHAVRLWFNEGKLGTCVGTRLSTNPLAENHGFATIPNPDGKVGWSVLVSNAGDWTKKTINNPPTHIWTRGAFTTGVLRVALLFKPVIIVATGSGIGPCLSFLQVQPDWPCRIIWSTRAPEKTYGTKILDSVYRSDSQALIIDSKRFRTGYKPDIAALAYGLYRKISAEAVVIISNPKSTRDVVGRLERRRVPAYGAIFDS